MSNIEHWANQRWDPLPYFEVVHPVRDQAEGQNIMAAYEAGKAEAANRLRGAVSRVLALEAALYEACRDSATSDDDARRAAEAYLADATRGQSEQFPPRSQSATETAD